MKTNKTHAFTLWSASLLTAPLVIKGFWQFPLNYFLNWYPWMSHAMTEQTREKYHVS